MNKLDVIKQKIMAEKDEEVLFDERYLKSLVKKMEKLKNKIDTFKDTLNDLESEFTTYQREYFKVEKTIKEQNNSGVVSLEPKGLSNTIIDGNIQSS